MPNPRRGSRPLGLMLVTLLASCGEDSNLAGPGEPALDDSLEGIPSDMLFHCHVGAEGMISREGKADSSCNAVFPKLGHISKWSKRLLLTSSDDHGDPALSSEHGVCTAGPGFGCSVGYRFSFV